MTDSFILDDEPYALQVPVVATLPTSTITAGEWDALKGRVTVVEGLGLVDLSDVDTTGLANGLTLVYDSASGTWKPGSSGGTIATVKNNTTTVRSNVSELRFLDGISATAVINVAGVVELNVQYGGTGSANLAARSDHTHTPATTPKFPFAASGVLSSGTRTLVNDTITGLSPGTSYTIIARLRCNHKNTINNGTVRFSLQVGAAAADTADEPNVGGVPAKAYLEATGTTGGVSSIGITATVQYQTGDPTDILAGCVYVTTLPRS